MFKNLRECNVTNKVVFVRADMNVSFKNEEILDDTRIKSVIPTVKYLIENNAKVILTSHLGRPKGNVEEKYSLKHILPRIKELLGNTKVNFSNNCIGNQTKKDIENTEFGEVVLLENLRFHVEEENNDSNFAKELASFAEIYVNDAFSCCHRKHASIVGIPEILEGYPSFSLQKELKKLTTLVSDPEQPLMFIVGGSKVSTKLELLGALIEKGDYLVVGGGMANTFLYAKNKQIGKSLFEPDLTKEALQLLDKAKENNCNIILPVDVIVCTKIEEYANCRNTNVDEINENEIIADLGEQSILNIEKALVKCKTVIWNGPLGIYEVRPFNEGTDIIARKIKRITKNNELKSIAGGGDILAALNQANLIDYFSYVSTAGGAFLKWLENGKLPGVEKLKL